MFCKYCGTEIANDSIFCAKCGKKIQEDAPGTHNEKCDDSNSVRVHILADNNDIWRDTNNLQWKKPIVARVVQTILLIIGLFFLCYGIIWCCIIEKKAEKFGNCSQYPFFDDIAVYAEEPLGLINVDVDLERDNPNYYTYKSEWEELYKEKYYEKDNNPVIRALAFEDYESFYEIAITLAVSRFRIKALFVFILPALIIIVLSVIWFVKITPKVDKKTILPRDYADKIESYAWNGFSLHKYIRFIKDDKYGIMDAANRSITVPATFDLIEWRETNKSYDGVLDGVRKTYNLYK